MRFNQCKAEQPLWGMELQEKEAQKDYNIQEICLERNYILQAGKHETLLQIDIMIWWGWSGIPKVSKIASLQCFYNISNKKLKMKLIFCMEINIRVSYKFISTLWTSALPTRLRLSSLVDMIKHAQITQSNKFAISLQYLMKEVRNGGHFWHADKCQSFYKLVLS